MSSNLYRKNSQKSRIGLKKPANIYCSATESILQYKKMNNNRYIVLWDSGQFFLNGYRGAVTDTLTGNN
jgi:hypothetical protein